VFLRAQLLDETGKLMEAIEDYQRALDLNPRDDTYQYHPRESIPLPVM
jgi:tetratricopeptide (TPR) repeat protein